MPNAELGIVLEGVSLLGAFLLCLKLFQTGLWRRYLFFFWYFLFRVFDSTWPLFLKSDSSLYQELWMLTEPVAWLFHILVVFELYRLVLQDHKGIYTLGRWAMFGALAITIPMSVLSLIPHFTVHTPDKTRYMGYEFATSRGIDLSLALLLLLMLLFLSRYPIKLSRNVVVHAALYTILFFSDAFAVFLRTFKIVATETLNNAVVGLSCGCIAAWLILLSPRGEQVHVHLPSPSPQREKNALRQLESLNAILLKASGR
jgi:hypothetical protein